MQQVRGSRMGSYTWTEIRMNRSTHQQQLGEDDPIVRQQDKRKRKEN